MDDEDEDEEAEVQEESEDGDGEATLDGVGVLLWWLKCLPSLCDLSPQPIVSITLSAGLVSLETTITTLDCMASQFQVWTGKMDCDYKCGSIVALTKILVLRLLGYNIILSSV